MRQYLDLTSWILLFLLAPFTVLVLLSQNSVPGDLVYPIKRGMENLILVAASVSPSSRIAFRTDLTERRFKEAQFLLVQKQDIRSLSDFVTEVQQAQQEISKVSDPLHKKEASEKLIAKIDIYQEQLVQIQNQVQAAPTSPVVEQPSQPTSQPFITNPFQPQATPAPTQQEASQNQPIQTNQTVAQTPTPTPQSIPVSSPSKVIVPPTSAPIQTPIAETKKEIININIENTKQELKKTKDKLEEDKKSSEKEGEQKKEREKKESGQESRNQ